MKNLIKILILSLFPLSLQSQNSIKVLLKKEVAEFYYEESLYAEMARKKITNLNIQLSLKDTLISNKQQLIQLYKSDSSLYKINLNNLEKISNNKDIIIVELNKSIKKEKIKTKGILGIAVIILLISIL